MNLKTYIEAIGDEAAAKQFGVKPRTTKSWRLGDRRPRPAQVPKIIEGSGGALDWSSIYHESPKPKNSREPSSRSASHGITQVASLSGPPRASRQ